MTRSMPATLRGWAAGLSLALAATVAVPAGAAPKDDAHGDHSAAGGMAGMRASVPDFAENFRLIDHRGASHELYYYKDAPAIVIMTQGNGCPIVRGAIPGFQDIRDQYAEKGVQFYMLNSNLQDDRDEVQAEAEEYGIDVPVLMDTFQLIGESLGVNRTAEVFVIDPAQGFKIVYHGPMDDRQDYERQRSDATETYLTDALDQMLAGEAVTVEGPALSPGCLVNFPERARRDQHANISYAEDVAPILLTKCAECHQPGGIGPWAMTDYETVVGWAPMMREVIRTKRMPPWHADPHIGSFMGDRSLTAEQIKTVVHWIEAGTPRGEGKDPLVDADLKSPDWPLGEPDLILDIPSYDVPATGIVDYQHPLVENPLKEEKWLKAVTFKAGARDVVHHILSGYISEVPEDGMGYASRWEFATGGYAVGAESIEYGDEAGVPVPPGGAIGFQMHYTPTGKAATDASQMGLYFHDEVPTYINRTSVILDASIVIPPNEGRHEEIAYMEFPEDAVLMMAFPHAHYRGHASKLTLRYPDGEEKVLLALPKYDFNWQRSYFFEEPVDIPAGSKLIAHYLYDNSERNFANPDASQQVTWGEQSHEEMLYTAFLYRWKGETTSNRLDEYTERLDRHRLFTSMDDNFDGQLQEAEFRGLVGERMRASFARMDADQSGGVSKEEFLRARAAMRQRRGN